MQNPIKSLKLNDLVKSRWKSFLYDNELFSPAFSTKLSGDLTVEKGE